MYTVYILYSAVVDRYYVGQTSNLADRLRRHNKGHNQTGAAIGGVYIVLMFM